MLPQAIAEVQNLSYSYGDFKALNDVSLTLKPGEILSILGPNGAGKTTLINTILGRKKNYKGQVSVFGNSPGALAAKRQTGAMLQVSGLPDMIKVSEHIELFQAYYPSPMAIEQVIDIAGLEAIIDSRSAELSGGQKQRLLFALAICGNPRLLMLDEPTVGLDIMSRRSLWRAIENIRDEGVCVVLTTHYLEEADKLADRICMLNRGQIIREGTPDEIKRNMAHQTITFQTDVPLSEIQLLDSVVDVKAVNKLYEIASMDAVLTLTSLFAKAISIQNLTVANASLEEAFVRLSETSPNADVKPHEEELANEH